jgi:hypothetical protein
MTTNDDVGGEGEEEGKEKEKRRYTFCVILNRHKEGKG